MPAASPQYCSYFPTKHREADIDRVTRVLQMVWAVPDMLNRKAGSGILAIDFEAADS
jgi:hypothetical protein